MFYLEGDAEADGRSCGAEAEAGPEGHALSEPTKTDVLKSAIIEELERRRKEIDVSYCNGSSTVAIIIRLRQGRPFKVSFRTESELNL